MSAQTQLTATPRPLVLLDTVTTTALPDRVAALEQNGAVIEFVDYTRLSSAVPRLKRLLREHELDFLLFARNDQVYDRRAIGVVIRALGVGYSSFSGIDTEYALTQARTCLDDYLSGGTTLGLAPARNEKEPLRGDAPTFSLLFDVEQLACARFGLERILGVLDEFDAPATFFATTFIREIYKDVFELLAGRSHEIGLHGLYHEYLAGRDLETQQEMLAAMKAGCGEHVRVTGANFIGRMDDVSVEAMARSGLSYFVAFMGHRYEPFAYRRMPSRPMRMAADAHSIWMVPVNVETNNRPWHFVKRLIDAEVRQDDRWQHVNVLLHPFRDGALRHIGDLQRLLSYLTGTLGYRPARLGDVVAQLPESEPEAFVHYTFSGQTAPKAPWQGAYLRRWWHDRSRYERRVGSLYDALVGEGMDPALAVGSKRPAGRRRPTFAVYPHLPAAAVQPLRDPDPLDPRFDRLSGAVSEASATANGSSLVFAPRGRGSDVGTAVRALRPRSSRDYTGLVPEAALRVAYRLTKGRHVF